MRRGDYCGGDSISGQVAQLLGPDPPKKGAQKTGVGEAGNKLVEQLARALRPEKI